MAVRTTEAPRWWNSAADLHTHIEDWLASEAPMLQYDLETGVYHYAQPGRCCMCGGGNVWMVSCGPTSGGQDEQAGDGD